MRIHCPNCGPRDSREFHYRGSAELFDRPAADADQATFLNYVYLRDNPAGPHRELWLHDSGCRSWVMVERNTATHEILATQLAVDVKRGGK
jgi:heterotetrameric sarcosine oxidase delta subunit